MNSGMKIKQIILILCTLLIALPALAETDILPDVSLSAGKGSKQKVSREHEQTTTFQQTDLAQSPSTNLAQLFQQEQSTIHLTNNSGDSSQTALSIRGFGDNAGQNTLILIDGFPLLNASLLTPNFNSIPLTDIERIDIYQGSKGTLWGNQAVGGVVSITTRHPEKFFANAVLTVGSYKTLYTNFIVADKFKHGIFIKAFGVVAQADNFRDHNQSRNNNLALQVGVDDPAGTTSINVQSFQTTTNFPGGLSLQQLIDNPVQAVNFTNYSNFRTNIIQLLNKHAFSDDWLLETRLSQQVIHGNGRVVFDYTSQDSILSFDPRVIGHVHGNKIVFGYDGQLDQYQLNNIKIDTQTKSAQNDGYFQLTIPMTKQLDFSLGARGAWQNNSAPASLNHVFVSEEGLEYHLNKTLSFYLRRDGNFSFPKANEQVSAQMASTRLLPQTGTSYETGMNWNDDKSEFQLNLYRLDLQNELAFNPEQTPLQPFGAWSNFAPTQRNGVTVAETYHLSDPLKLNVQLNYVQPRFLNGNLAGNTIPAVPRITGNAGIDYQVHEDWQLKYFLTYTGSRYASDDINNTGPQLAHYWLNNAAAQYSKKNVVLSLEVMNLLNQTYVTYASYNASTNADIYYPAAGRNVMLTLKVNIA